MTALPAGLSASDEVMVTWDNGEGGTEVVITLGGAKVTVFTDHESAELVPWIVASLPNILTQAWDAIEAAEDQEATQ